MLDLIKKDAGRERERKDGNYTSFTLPHDSHSCHKSFPFKFIMDKSAPFYIEEYTVPFLTIVIYVWLLDKQRQKSPHC